MLLASMSSALQYDIILVFVLYQSSIISKRNINFDFSVRVFGNTVCNVIYRCQNSLVIVWFANMHLHPELSVFAFTFFHEGISRLRCNLVEWNLQLWSHSASKVLVKHHHCVLSVDASCILCAIVRHILAQQL